MTDKPAELSQRQVIKMLFDDMVRLNKSSQTANVISISQSLDGFLEEIICANMPQLSNKLRDDLFRGYGPFSTFKAKIDTAYALGFIDQRVRGQIHIFRAIRNLFAHPEDYKSTSFEDENPKMDKQFSKFDDYKPGTDRSAFLTVKFKAVLSEMQPALNNAYALRAQKEKGE